MFFRLSLLIGLVFCCSSVALGQRATIHGLVRDQSGKAIPLVQVFEKGNRANGTASDDNGRFTLSIPGDQDILIILKSTGVNESEKTVHLKSGEIRDLEITYDPAVELDQFIIVDTRER